MPVAIWRDLVEQLLSVFGLALPAPDEAPQPVLGLDKIVHMVLFFGLALQLDRSARAEGRSLLLAVFVACTIYGFALEGAQSLVGRVADLWDGVADALGALLFVAPALWSRRSSGVPLDDD